MLTNEDWERIERENTDDDLRGINWWISQAFMGDEFEAGIWDDAQVAVPVWKAPVRNKVRCGPWPEHMLVNDEPVDGPYPQFT